MKVSSGEMLFSNPPEKLMAVSLDRSGRGERWGPPLEIHEAPPPGTPLSSFGWARYSDLALAVSRACLQGVVTADPARGSDLFCNWWRTRADTEGLVVHTVSYS